MTVPTLSDVDFATQGTLAAVLAKIISAPATEAKQDTGNASLASIAGFDFATQTTLAALLAKVIAAPSTEAKQDAANTLLTAISGYLASGATAANQSSANTKLDTIAAKDFATQTTLAALLAKVIAAPSTEAKQDSAITLLTTIASAIEQRGTTVGASDFGIPALMKRMDADSTIVSDGQYTGLNCDEEGRLKVATKPASYADITGDITTTQPVISTPVAGGTVSGDVSRASSVRMFCTGTFNTVNCTFEGSIESSGDTNWFGIQAVRSNANTVETTTGNLSAAPGYAWELSVNALSRVRVRATARTSGTQSWRMKLGTYATEPIPAAQVSATQPVSGTVTANIGSGSLAAGTNLIGDVGGQVRATAGGMASISRLVSAAASTNGTIVKASAGRVYKIRGYNAAATIRYLKFSNATSVTVGTTAVTETFILPALSVFEIDFGAIGRYFSTGICYGLTTGAPDNDTGALTAADVAHLNVYFA